MTHTLRIATFNLENLDDRPRAGIDFEERLRVLRPQMERLRADVLCLQEINAHSHGRRGPRPLTALDRLIAGTAYEGFERVVSLNRGGKRPSDKHNLVILSRLPVLSQAQLWHDLVPPPLYQPATERPRPDNARPIEWDRPLLHAALDLGDGRRLHVVNLHLRAPRAAHIEGQKRGRGVWTSVGGWAEGFYIAEMKRAGQALEARLLVEQVFDVDADALVAVCGDFNASDREVPVRTIRGDEEDTGNGGLAHRVLVPLDRTIGAQERYSVIHHGTPLMLDHVVVSRPLLAWYRGCEVHNEALGDEVVSPSLIGNSPESYHAPVVAEFEIP